MLARSRWMISLGYVMRQLYMLMKRLIVVFPKLMIALKSLLVLWFKTTLSGIVWVDESKITWILPCFSRIPCGIAQQCGETYTTQTLKDRMWLFFSSLFIVFEVTLGCWRKVCWFPFCRTKCLLSYSSLKSRQDGHPWFMILWICSPSLLQMWGDTTKGIFFGVLTFSNVFAF